MFTYDSELEVKNAAVVLEIVEDFVKMKPKGSNFTASCPLHDEKTASFFVSPEKGIYKCFGCGAGGDGLDFLQKKLKITYPEALQYVADKYNLKLVKEGDQNYVIPEWKNNTQLSDKVVKWFTDRKISPGTLVKAKITEGIESMPVDKGFVNMNTMQFNYFRDEKLVNTKFRGKNKVFKLVSGAELIFYGLDSLKGKKEAIIVEGECFTEDCELLTKDGWKNINKVSDNDLIAQFKENYEIEYIKPLARIEKHYCGKLIEIKNKQKFYSLTTENHNLVFQNNNKTKWFKAKANSIPVSALINRIAKHSGKGIHLTNDQIRLCIAVSADFTLRKTGDIYGCFKKERKVERLNKILTALKIPFSNNEDSRGYRSIFIKKGDAPKYLFKIFPMSWIHDSTQEQKDLILKEILFWDGNSVPNREQIEYSSKEIHNATFIQTLSHLNGYVSTIIHRENKFGKWFKVSILFNKNHTSTQSIQKNEIDFDGKVYCFTVPSGMLLVRQKECISVSGNCDALALIEAGMDQNYAILSVPNGASKHRNNLTYLNNCIKDFEHIETIHLGLDNDANGRKLREELADRFGKHRCDYLDWKNQKDANDVLIKYGVQGIIDCCSKPVKFPLEGAFTISDIGMEIEDMYAKGLDKGVHIGLKDFSMRIVKGYITIVTGIPGHGKSEAVDEICMRLTTKHNQNGAFYSPENKPTQLHYSKMASRLVGKAWEGENRITKEENRQVQEYLDKKVWFIKPEKDFSLTSILASIRNLQIRFGLDYFVIDAWNKLEHKDNDTHAVGKALDELAVFCEMYNLHCFLVAHPTKIDKDKKTGMFMVPTLYNISGSSNFYNKADNGLCIYLDKATGICTWYRQKIKFKHFGWVGDSEYLYEPKSGRYYASGYPDFTNWITGKMNTPPPTELPLETPVMDFDPDLEPF